ncbi:MAG: hypothetical protein GXO22_08395 [Aquificae bacterium]|nr:hypothetical protein [Aquificota bacterium]
MRKFVLSFFSIVLASSSFGEVPPEVKQDYTPPRASIGYGNTLFESANEYCMHCHYDLHDTWSKSMHANSWQDPIFQKLYQAFLKYMVMNKLGATGPTGTFTEATAEKLGKICLGCHAPNALYSQDFKIEIEEVSQVGPEQNLYSSFDPNLLSILYATNQGNGKTYKISYHIGNPNNREGINCALCHSIEEIKMAHPGDTYTLTAPIKIGPIGPIVFDAGTVLHYGDLKEMNAFFKIVGPEMYLEYYDTRNSQKIRDGRFRIKPIFLYGVAGIYYAGGPYYGPFGVTALDNIEDDDATDREAIANNSGFLPEKNHYYEYVKTLCLSCHQRSAGTIDQNPDNTLGLFMELCTTFNAIDQNPESTEYTPKCTKCHMEARDGILINQWKKEGVAWDIDAIPTDGIKKIAQEGIFYSHGFEGASYPDKVASGMEIKILDLSVEDGKVKVKYHLKNKTAHMFPGAHPMRRVITILKVYDKEGNPLKLLSATGISDFQDVVYTYNKEGFAQEINVEVKKRDETVDFLGKVPDLEGDTVCSQWIDFDIQTSTGTKRIIDECDKTQYKFARVYGRELFDINTGIIQPGFAANTSKDNRLSPNEIEIYEVEFELPEGVDKDGIKAELKAYYHKIGATGIVPVTEDEWIDLEAVEAQSLPVYVTGEVSKTIDSGGGCTLSSRYTDAGLILSLIAVLGIFIIRKRNN